MRTLDKQARAQRIYKHHMKQKLSPNPERSPVKKTVSSGGQTLITDPGLKPNRQMEVTESIHSSKRRMFDKSVENSHSVLTGKDSNSRAQENVSKNKSEACERVQVESVDAAQLNMASGELHP